MNVTHWMPPCWICTQAQHPLRGPWVPGFPPPSSGTVHVFAFAASFFLLLWVFAFAVKCLLLPWGILFLPWGLWFCREVFCFCHEVFCFCREGSGFAVTVNTTVHVLYTIGGHRFILIPQPIKCPLQLDFPLNERSNDKVRASGVLKQFRFKKYTTLIPFCKVLFSKQLHLVNQTVQLHSIC